LPVQRVQVALVAADVVQAEGRPEDIYAEKVRIRIWRMPRPDYDSGWVSLTAGAAATTLYHNLGGSVFDYLVDMQHKTGDTNGVNLRYYGGADFGATAFGGTREDDRVGAYWRGLTTSSITVYRRPEDGFADYIYLRIWVIPYHVYLPMVLRNFP